MKQLSPKQQEVLRKYSFRPGRSGNPGGNSKKRHMASAYAALLSQKYPRDKQNRTWAERIALAVAKKAAKGDTAAAKLITLCTEGPPKPVAATNASSVSIDAFANMSDAEMLEFIGGCTEVLKRAGKV